MNKHAPDLLTTLPCGCWISNAPAITYCPTHGAAPEMVKILNAVFIDKEHPNLWSVTARALLARIEGEK